MGRTVHGPQLGGAGAESQGYFRICCQMEVGWLAFRGTNKHVSLWPPRWQDYFLDCGREELEPSYRAISEWEVRLSLASLPQGASRSQLSGLEPDHGDISWSIAWAKDCGSIA